MICFSTRCSRRSVPPLASESSHNATFEIARSRLRNSVANALFTFVLQPEMCGCKLLIWRALQDSNLRPPGSPPEKTALAVLCCTLLGVAPMGVIAGTIMPLLTFALCCSLLPFAGPCCLQRARKGQRPPLAHLITSWVRDRPSRFVKSPRLPKFVQSSSRY